MHGEAAGVDAASYSSRADEREVLSKVDESYGKDSEEGSCVDMRLGLICLNADLFDLLLVGRGFLLRRPRVGAVGRRSTCRSRRLYRCRRLRHDNEAKSLPRD